MAIRKVARMGHPILREVAQKLSVEEIQSPRIQQLIADMIETMQEYEGIGLAAPQIHESLQIAIIGFSEKNGRYPGAGVQPLTVLINPKITVIDSTLRGGWEGCLSIPGIRGWVERPSKIRVESMNHEGRPQVIVAENFLSTVFQHELDHLQGVLFIDRVEDRTRLSFLEEYHRYWPGGAKQESEV